VLFAGLASALSGQTDSQLRDSVTRALPILERSAAEFVAKRACISCHHNILPVLAFHLAIDQGFAVDRTALGAVEEKTLRGLRGPAALDDAVQAVTLNDPTPNDSYLLMAAHAAGEEVDLAAAVYTRRLMSWQRDGHWVTSDFRPPHSSSLFTATATAVRAIRLYLPQELRAEGEACIARARLWLVAARPVSTEDAAFRLMGLVWAEASGADVSSARRDLLALQKRSGGWPQIPGYPSDAYSTGEALFALHEAGTPVSESGWRNGLKFLISTQARDGSWRVRTRMISPAEVSPKYFATGFPYQKDEFLSYAGSCWAVMALLAALPDAPDRAVATAAAGTTTWIRTALFGTLQELAALLDSGLDPNSETERGTTLLMLAAPNAEKVRLLLARGAHVKTRSPSGADALTIATAYRGAAEAVRALLDAGAEITTPHGIRARNSPLVSASMTGDLEIVRLLLAHGADPSASSPSNTPLAAAVTFGYPDVVRELIKAGASVSLTERSGINLLHWAAITNRAAVIPALAEAGVPLNATDQFGYTPLMYAATIDFGDAASLKALVKAGADPHIRNDEGRTPREQARHYKHAQLEAALP
jgi:N-acyl-D-amino-acid deacylase